MELVTLESPEALRQAATEWNALWERSLVALPTARAELVALWAERFSRQANFKALAVRDGNRMVAALPTVVRRAKGIWPVADLTSNCWSPNGELLVDPAADTAAALDLLARRLSTGRWPLLWFDMVPSEQPHWLAFMAAAKRQGMAVETSSRYRIGLVRTEGQFTAYLAARSRNLRRSVERDRKKLEAEGPLETLLLRPSTDQEVEARLREAFELEHRSWKGAEGSSVLSAPGIYDFYLSQARQLARWGDLFVAFLLHAGRPIAFELGWMGKRVYHSFKVGYDGEYRRYGPGHLLRRAILEALFADDQTRLVDFQGPTTEAIAAWATDDYGIGRVVMASPRPGGRMTMVAYRSLSTLARRWRQRRRTSASQQKEARDGR